MVMSARALASRHNLSVHTNVADRRGDARVCVIRGDMTIFSMCHVCARDATSRLVFGKGVRHRCCAQQAHCGSWWRSLWSRPIVKNPMGSTADKAPNTAILPDGFPILPGEDLYAHAATQYAEDADAILASRGLLAVAKDGEDPPECKSIINIPEIDEKITTKTFFSMLLRVFRSSPIVLLDFSQAMATCYHTLVVSLRPYDICSIS